MSKKGQWKEEAFRDQLSTERDFPEHTEVGFRYAICCGHRTGSNLLGEALYKTGLAGDPMEYFNKRLLNIYFGEGINRIDFNDYMSEMEARRTSPNGVFGVNVKMDQLRMCFQKKWNAARQLIRANDYVLFLYRRDKLRQAISSYIGQTGDMFNVPAEVTDEEVSELVREIPFNPLRIANNLEGLLQIDQVWMKFFKNNEIEYEPLAYEDFTADYEGTLDHILAKCGVASELRVIPEQPLKKISNSKNEEFRERFLALLQGNYDMIADIGALEDLTA